MLRLKLVKQLSFKKLANLVFYIQSYRGFNTACSRVPIDRPKLYKNLDGSEATNIVQAWRLD